MSSSCCLGIHFFADINNWHPDTCWRMVELMWIRIGIHTMSVFKNKQTCIQHNMGTFVQLNGGRLVLKERRETICLVVASWGTRKIRWPLSPQLECLIGHEIHRGVSFSYCGLVKNSVGLTWISLNTRGPLRNHTFWVYCQCATNLTVIPGWSQFHTFHLSTPQHLQITFNCSYKSTKEPLSCPVAPIEAFHT